MQATAGPRFTETGAAKLDYRRFWDVMNQLTADHLEEISTRVATRIVAEYVLDTSSAALDMTRWAASKRPCCSTTTDPRADPAPNARSPTTEKLAKLFNLETYARTR
ncbi:hypothetical protein AQ436_15890 [Arthrobacter sp. EpRS66]|nr:hypothetical protein AQ436_15890 [Arthrobacter sp. EpRS66]